MFTSVSKMSHRSNRSRPFRDGISNWQRHPAILVRVGTGKWDHNALLQAYCDIRRKKWLLWYNAAHALEQIGVVLHEGEDLGFPANP